MTLIQVYSPLVVPWKLPVRINTITRPVINLRLVSRQLLKSGQMVRWWLASAGGIGQVIRLRPVSRLMKKSGRLMACFLVLIGSTRPVISLRPVSRLLMKSGQLVVWHFGSFLCNQQSSVMKIRQLLACILVSWALGSSSSPRFLCNQSIFSEASCSMQAE